jgi:hypothetical protein
MGSIASSSSSVGSAVIDRGRSQKVIILLIFLFSVSVCITTELQMTSLHESSITILFKFLAIYFLLGNHSLHFLQFELGNNELSFAFSHGLHVLLKFLFSSGQIHQIPFRYEPIFQSNNSLFPSFVEPMSPARSVIWQAVP